MPIRIPPLPGMVLRLARWVRGVSASQLARKAGLASASAITMYERDPKRVLPRVRLDELLSLMDIPPEFVDASLYALTLVSPPEAHPSLVGLTKEELWSIERAAARGGLATLEAIRRELARNFREQRAAMARQEAVTFWEMFRQLNSEEQGLLVETALERFNWAYAERLALESARAAPHSADRAEELARLAVLVAEKAPVPKGSRPFLLGWCWAFLGNARRVQGFLPDAEKAFLQADELWLLGQGEPWPLDASRLLDLKASLRMYQGRFEESLSLLGQAVKAATPGPSVGRLVLKEARALELLGNYGQALECLQLAEKLVDEIADPRVLFGIRFNVVVNLAYLERYREGEALLDEVRRRAVALGNELDLVRVLWIQARIWAGLGRRAEAAAAFLQVQEEFTLRTIPFDAALVSLELAMLWLEEGRTKEVKELALSMVWIFESQEVQKEALAALTLFREAASQEGATAAFTRRVLCFLERAREAPALRFES